MIKREELLKTEEFWFETIQNEIYRTVANYIEQKGITQSQLANKLGVSKGYISQILNGNFNYTLKKLIELSLAVNKVPMLDFKDIEDFIIADSQKRIVIQYRPFLKISSNSETTKAFPIQSSFSSPFKNANEIPNLEVA